MKQIFLFLLIFSFSNPVFAKKTLKANKMNILLKRNVPSFPNIHKEEMKSESLFQYAKKHNKTLIRLRKSVDIAKHKEKQSGVWPDLKVGVAGSNFPMPTFNPATTAMSGIVYSVSQKFPILGKLYLQRKIAGFTTSMIQEHIREEENRIHFHIRKALYRLTFLRKSYGIEKNLFLLMGQAASVAKTKYMTGKAPQQDYLQALTLQATNQTQMLSIVGQHQVWRHRLLQHLGKNEMSRLGRSPMSFKMLKQKSEEKYLAQAMKNRGLIKQWLLYQKQSKQLLRFAKVRFWPDITLQVAVRQRFANPIDQGQPFLSVGVKIPIPSWGNTARFGLIKEALSRRQMAIKKIKEMRRKFLEKIRILRTKIAQYDAQTKILKKKIIPLAKQTYRSSLHDYQVNRIDFTTTLSNLKTLYKKKRKLDNIRMKKAISIAQLYQVMGM